MCERGRRSGREDRSRRGSAGRTSGSSGSARVRAGDCRPEPAPSVGTRQSESWSHGYFAAAWWRNGRASDMRSRGREFDPRPVRGCVTTLGKLFTPNCLDADSLRYHMESINRVPVLFIARLLFHSRNTRLFISVSDLHSEVFVRSDFRFLTLETALGVTA